MFISVEWNARIEAVILSRLFQRKFYKYLSWNAQINACNKTVHRMENLLSELRMQHRFWGPYANIVFKLVQNWGALQYYCPPITFQKLKGTLKSFSLSMGGSSLLVNSFLLSYLYMSKNWRPPRLRAFGSGGRKRNTYEYACLLTRPDCCRNRKKFWMNQLSLQLSW